MRSRRGAIDVSGEMGGNVNVLGVGGAFSQGGRVALLGTVDASGTNGGGTVWAGGDVRGSGTVPTADATFVGPDGAIDVSALEFGDGGTAIVWADDTTQFFGNIAARGGAFSGNGGFVETSGANVLESSGTVDASATSGLPGTWLLDPNDITIQDAGPDANVTGDPLFTTTDDSAIVTTASIETSLNAGTSVSVTTASAGANGEAGDITVASPIEKTEGTEATLTLDADRDILVNAGISSTHDRLNVTLNAMGGVDVNANITTNGGNFIATGAAGLPSSGGHGILVRGGRTIDAIGGNIDLVGTGNASPSGDGIHIEGNLQTNGMGAIDLTGTGGSGTNDNNGIFLSTGAMVRSQNGGIDLTGTGNGSGDFNQGILSSGTIASTGTGCNFPRRFRQRRG